MRNVIQSADAKMNRRGWVDVRDFDANGACVDLSLPTSFGLGGGVINLQERRIDGVRFEDDDRMLDMQLVVFLHGGCARETNCVPWRNSDNVSAGEEREITSRRRRSTVRFENDDDARDVTRCLCMGVKAEGRNPSADMQRYAPAASEPSPVAFDALLTLLRRAWRRTRRFRFLKSF
jgi:hypothetical protein